MATHCAREAGYCVKPNGRDQNDGVKQSLNQGSIYQYFKSRGSSRQTDIENLCLAMCLETKGATGCETTWGWRWDGGGCRVHTREVSRGNGSANKYNCWVFSKCTKGKIYIFVKGYHRHIIKCPYSAMLVGSNKTSL